MKKLIILSCILAISHLSYSQGCSDAGFCSMESFKNHETEDSIVKKEIPNTFKFGTTYGQGQHAVSIINPYIEYTEVIDSSWSSTIKITSALHSGTITSKFDISDVLLSVNYNTHKKILFVAGIKIPLASGAQTFKDEVLPMGYQSSLGTLDAIFGLSYRYKGFALTTAIQHVLVQNNSSFILENTKLENLDGNFISTNNYNRASDVLLRIAHAWKIKVNAFTLSVLPIYHLWNDTYTDLSNNEIEFADSQGLTLNINSFYRHKISESAFLEFSIGGPAITRKTRPDGLSQFSIGLEFIKQL